MVQDLIKADGDREQIKLLGSVIENANSTITKQDSVISTYKQKSISYESTLNEYEEIDAANQRMIEALNKKAKRYKKQRNLFKILLGGALIGLSFTL